MAPLTEMNVYVPSRSRFIRSLTLEALVGHWDADKIFLVVPAAQAPQYRPLASKHGVQLLPCKVDGIARTRQACGIHAGEKFAMFDDDLRFYTCTKDDWHLHQFGKHDMAALLLFISRLLDPGFGGFKHVSVCPRGGSNQLWELGFPLVENKRPLRVLAYRKKEFLECEHGRVAIMEDFDVTLQLIRRGFPNALITQYVQDQPVTQAPGGCSDYRTHALHEANVRKLAALHPGLVKLRQKENKTGGEFGTRMEATIYWARAYQQALEEAGI